MCAKIFIVKLSQIFISNKVKLVCKKVWENIFFSLPHISQIVFFFINLYKINSKSTEKSFNFLLLQSEKTCFKLMFQDTFTVISFPLKIESFFCLCIIIKKHNIFHLITFLKNTHIYYDVDLYKSSYLFLCI